MQITRQVTPVCSVLGQAWGNVMVMVRLLSTGIQHRVQRAAQNNRHQSLKIVKDESIYEAKLTAIFFLAK